MWRHTSLIYAFAFGVGRVSGAATDSSGCRGAGDETRRNGGEGGDRERERACARAAEMNPAVRMRGPPGRCNQRVTSQQVREPRQHNRAMHTLTHSHSLMETRHVSKSQSQSSAALTINSGLTDRSTSPRQPRGIAFPWQPRSPYRTCLVQGFFSLAMILLARFSIICCWQGRS